MAIGFVVICSLFLAIYGQSFDAGYSDGLLSLSHLTSLDNLPQAQALPLVHKLVNINNLNNAGGNVTINEIRRVVDAMDTNIDNLNNAKNGNLVFNDIQKLSNSIHKSQKLLKKTGVVKLNEVNSATEIITEIVKKMKEVFTSTLELTGKELDLFFDVLLSGAMGILYSRVQEITEKDIKTSDPDAKRLLKDVTSAKTLSNAFKKLRAIVVSETKYSKKLSFQHKKKKPAPHQYQVPNPIRGTEDQGPGLKHCKMNPNHLHCKKRGQVLNGHDEAVMVLKPPAKKKLCLFNINQEYCIH